MIRHIGRAERPYALLAAALILSGLLGLLDGPAVLRLPLGLAAAAVPGVALLLLLGSRAPASSADRWLLGIGGSLAFLALAGVAVHFLGFQLGPLTWVVAVALFFGAGLVKRLGDHALPSMGGVKTVPGLKLLALAAVLFAAAFGTARLGVAVESGPEFTELWLLPTSSAEMYVVGVQSEESATREFRVEILLGAYPIETAIVALAPGESWAASVRIPGGQGASVVHARLYREGDPRSYRHAFLRPAPDTP